MKWKSLGVKGKIIGMSIAVVLIAISATVGPILYLQSEKMYQSYQDQAIHTTRAMEEMFAENANKTRAVASLAVAIPGLPEAVVSNNDQSILNLIQSVPKSGVDYVTVTDKSGVVLARTHDKKTGDSISSIYAIQQAMAGNTTTTVESSPVTPLSIRTCIPIRTSDGQVVGTFSASIDGAQQRLVDKVKEIYNVDATVFGGDTRVSTTVTNKEGQRAIGTKASDVVATKVLRDKAMFTGIADVNGKPYVTSYRPIIGANDKSVGMLFVGISLDKYYQDRNNQILITSLSALAVLVVCISILYWLTRILYAPLQKITIAVSEIATGNLSVSVDHSSSDEFGVLSQGFNNMVSELKKLVSMVNNQAESLAAASEELTAGAEQSALAAQQVADSIVNVAEGAALQLSSIEETARSIRNMSTVIQLAETSTNTVAVEAAEAASKAIQGDVMVKQAVSQMNHIQESVGVSSELVSVLGQRSQEIGQIIDTISAIAGQTNLLALNAAIEAARAGEQGRGFAVVAEEVRLLAEQSQEATRTIAGLINEIQADTNKAVQSMNNGTQEVGVGAKIVADAGNAFQEIERMILNVSKNVGALSSSIQEINQSSNSVVTTIDKISNLSQDATKESENVSAATQEQSASMQEMASSSQGLADMAQQLISAVRKFRT